MLEPLFPFFFVQCIVPCFRSDVIVPVRLLHHRFMNHTSSCTCAVFGACVGARVLCALFHECATRGQRTNAHLGPVWGQSWRRWRNSLVCARVCTRTLLLPHPLIVFAYFCSSSCIPPIRCSSLVSQFRSRECLVDLSVACSIATWFSLSPSILCFYVNLSLLFCSFCPLQLVLRLRNELLPAARACTQLYYSCWVHDTVHGARHARISEVLVGTFQRVVLQQHLLH